MKKALFISFLLAFYVFANAQTASNDSNMVFVKGGTFQMGSNEGEYDEQPIHFVTINDFYISKYEVTNAEFCEFLNDNKTDTIKSGIYAGQNMITDDKIAYWPWRIYKSGSNWSSMIGYANFPVFYVTWFGANEYCKWAGGRLPTEAEWEYAAGGGSDSLSEGRQKWAVANNVGFLNTYAWYSFVCDEAQQVGAKLPNLLGLYDMSGNVWEWCSDWYGKSYYDTITQVNPIGKSTGTHRVIRGGSFSDFGYLCRVSCRNSYLPTDSYINNGFRIVKDY